MKTRLASIRITTVLAHLYIWVWLLLFVMPFAALAVHAVFGQGGTFAAENFEAVFGSFGDNLSWSFRIAIVTIIIDLAIALPAAYALNRYRFRGKQLLFTLLSLPLYVPGAVIGLSLVLTFNFTYHLSTSVIGLIMAMAVGSFPLMLTPILVAFRDLPIVYEEAAECLGATKWQAFRRIIFPLLGPGVSAGLLLAFVIVFNEYLVTLFVAPPGITTAPLRIFNQVRTVGLQPTTAALAVTMQLISFLMMIGFFRIFGARYLKGTYLI